MKWNSLIALILIGFSQALLAVEPVTLSSPVPPISSTYATNTTTTVIYTLTNNVPNALPITVSGLSNNVSRTTVANDCGNAMPAGPATCNIGVSISPSNAQSGSLINQVLEIDYQGRETLKSPIIFSVVHAFVYIVPESSSSSILRFDLDLTTGNLTNHYVTAYTSGSQNFDALTFQTVNGVQYAYVLNEGGFVYKCTINSNETFDTCTATPPSPPSWMPRAIAFATVSGTLYGYVTDVGGGDIYQCVVQSNGDFTSCTVAASGFPAPYGMTFATTGSTQYAYIADAGFGGPGVYGSVYKCDVATVGPNYGYLTGCAAQSPLLPPPLPSPLEWIPYDIAFTTVGGTQYAYVADNGSTTTGNVYVCQIGTNGILTTCDATPAVGAPTTSWVPYNLAFMTMNSKQYAYVGTAQGPTLGGLFRCDFSLTNDGSFADNGCVSTPASPPSPWQPVGVAFKSN